MYNQARPNHFCLCQSDTSMIIFNIHMVIYSNIYLNQWIKTLQSAIKTQNEVIVNRITAVINQSTLDSLKLLDENLKQFIDSYNAILKQELIPNIIQNFHLLNIKEQIISYSQNNLKNLKEQLQFSISSLSSQQVNENAQSSLQDVMQLLLRASELYSKNIREALIFREIPNIACEIGSMEKLMTRDLNVEGRQFMIQQEVQNIKYIDSFKINQNQIFEIYYVKENIFLVSTFENELLIYDIKSRQVLQKLDPLRFAPASCLLLHVYRNNVLKLGQFLLLGGSEFDPNIYLYDLHKGRKIQTYPGHERSIKYLYQTGDINTFISSGRDSKIYFWNFQKAEPLQILNIPTNEIVDLQINQNLLQIYAHSIDGKLLIIQLYYHSPKQENGSQFGKAQITGLIEISQTSALTQILQMKDEIKLVLYSSGFLTGHHHVRIFEEMQSQTVRKLKKSEEFEVNGELQQLVTIRNKNKIYVIGIIRATGKLIVNQNVEIFENDKQEDGIQQALFDKIWQQQYN
ncbi:wD repeat domain [Paramecium bursaria]